jgi:hypothetical protein
LNCFTRTAGAESPWSLAKGNRIWNFLDSRAAEKARPCLNSASYCVNLLVQSPQKSEFPHREVGRCRKDPLSGLQSMCKESKCDCPGSLAVNVAFRLPFGYDSKVRPREIPGQS